MIQQANVPNIPYCCDVATSDKPLLGAYAASFKSTKITGNKLVFEACRLGYTYDAKANTCTIEIPITADASGKIAMCSVKKRGNGYVLSCEMPAKK